MLRFPFLLPLLLVSCLAGPLRAATLEGQSFSERVSVAGSELRLNGLGLRAVSIIKAYVVALYLPQPAASDQAVLSARGAKRLEIRMLRRAGAADFKRALLSGLRKNLAPEELARMQEPMAQLESGIDAIGTVHKGDVVALDFDPQRGLLLGLNGREQGASIGGADFYAAVLRIFVGERPVDEQLKRSLLGQALPR